MPDDPSCVALRARPFHGLPPIAQGSPGLRLPSQVRLQHCCPMGNISGREWGMIKGDRDDVMDVNGSKRQTSLLWRQTPIVGAKISGATDHQRARNFWRDADLVPSKYGARKIGRGAKETGAHTQKKEIDEVELRRPGRTTMAQPIPRYVPTRGANSIVPPPSAEFLARYNAMRAPRNINYRKAKIYSPPQSLHGHPLWREVLFRAREDEIFYNRIEEDIDFQHATFYRLTFGAAWTPTSDEEKLARVTIDQAIINRLQLVKVQKVLLRMYFSHLDESEQKKRIEGLQKELGYTRGQMRQDMPRFDRYELELWHTCAMDVTSDDPIDWDKLGLDYTEH